MPLISWLHVKMQWLQLNCMNNWTHEDLYNDGMVKTKSFFQSLITESANALDVSPMKSQIS